MARRLVVEGMEAVKQALSEGQGKGIVYVLFSGSLDEDGQSWCPDCVKADPVIEKSLDLLPEDSTFIRCHVGDRTFWKDQNNPFRTDPLFKLKCIPTLLKVGTPQRLQESECAKEDLIKMLFEDD